MMIVWRCLLAALTVFLSLQAPGQQKGASDFPSKFSFDDPKYRSVVVATVGDRSITGQEFLFSYEFGPAFPRREKDSRHRYLNFMVYEKLLALDGYARGLQKTSEARLMLSEITGDLATEELYKDDVRSKVKVSEQEISRGMKQDGVHLTVRWLYAPTESAIEKYRRELDRGVPFDTLLAGGLNDSVRQGDRSMETTLFKLETRNPSFAGVIDTMHAGMIGGPVKGPDGYYLVHLADRWSNPLITESDQAQMHEDVERALVQQKSDSLSDEYIKRLMEGERPTIVRKPFDLLQTHLGRIALPAEKFSAWNFAGRLKERWGITADSDLAPYQNSALVDRAHGRFTVRDFLNWYHAREENLHLNESSPQAFFLSLEDLVWRMVRDKLLVERANRRHLGKRPVVQNQVKWWEDKIVYKLVRAGIADSVHWNDSLLERYYQEHARNYRDGKNVRIPFTKAKEDVLKDYYSEQLTGRLLHRILALKQQYGVHVHDRELQSLPIEDEFDPKAIDVYAVKKGGTFPRPAFPTIDYEWQTWD